MPVLAAAAAFISTVPTTRGERKVAAYAIVASLLAFCLAAPFAQVSLPHVWAFIPLNQSAFFINDLITAILLLAQAPHLRSRALVVLASGYLFDALMIVPHTLTFPGLLSPTGLLGAGEQTTAWLYMFWHAGFPLFVIAYALIRETPQDNLANLPFRITVLQAIIMVVFLVLSLTLLSTSGQQLLPRVMAGNFYTPYTRVFTGATWLFSVIALGFLYRRRRASALDLWLSVVMCAWVFDVALSAVLNHGRFDFGFYAGRVYGLIAASFVLMMLLVESSYLYARLQQSQERLVQASKMEALGQLAGGIVHDFNNLLAVMQGGIELLECRTGPIEHDRLTRLLAPAKRAVERGEALTRSLLAFARQQTLAPQSVNINELVHQSSELLTRVLGRAVRIETMLSAAPCHCSVDPNQLETALINLAVNGRDAMPGGGVLTIQTETVDFDADEAAARGIAAGQYVVLSVSDTGAGMSPEVQRHAFEPFFTTKGPQNGTGLGLAQVYGFVSQSGGHIRLSSEVGKGTNVQMFLRALTKAERPERNDVNCFPGQFDNGSILPAHSFS